MKLNRYRFLKLITVCVMAVVLLAACGSNKPVPQVEPALTIISATDSAARAYHLIGTVQFPDGETPILEYSLNGADWQPVAINVEHGFSVVLMLNEGSNEIELALQIGETRIEKVITVNVQVSGAPVVAFTSGTLSQSASYRLTGFAVDDFGVERVAYRLNGG